MRTFDLGKYRKARVWWNQLPEATFLLNEVTTLIVPACNLAVCGAFEAAIELCVPVGPRVKYGLLGARFEATQTGKLIIKTGSSSSKGSLLDDNLAMRGDIVRVGLPSEYLKGVSKGVTLANTELVKLGAGVLTINCAAHAEISSSEAIFTQITLILTAVMACRGGGGDEELITVIQKMLK